jgi:hypothetical protein
MTSSSSNNLQLEMSSPEHQKCKVCGLKFVNNYGFKMNYCRGLALINQPSVIYEDSEEADNQDLIVMLNGDSNALCDFDSQNVFPSNTTGTGTYEFSMPVKVGQDLPAIMIEPEEEESSPHQIAPAESSPAQVTLPKKQKTKCHHRTLRFITVPVDILDDSTAMKMLKDSIVGKSTPSPCCHQSSCYSTSSDNPSSADPNECKEYLARELRVVSGQHRNTRTRRWVEMRVS